jgi:ferredoxin--NADP+ reductase
MDVVHDNERLRQELYNAAVVGLTRVHEDLMILHVRQDDGRLDFLPGQYTVLGLGDWEPHVEGTQAEAPVNNNEPKLIKRAYSISCQLLDRTGHLVRATDEEALEFYIALVRGGHPPPALTPRLFHLEIGDRLFLAPRVHGRYILPDLDAETNLVFAATGTGEAPHNAMLAELLSRQHRGRIVSTTCVRFHKDLAYLEKHRELERRFSNYRYLTLTTREPENLDSNHPGYVGKRYLQDYFESGAFERESGLTLDPADTQVFLCGSPGMIGVPMRAHDPSKRYPAPKGMIEVLEERGFELDRPHGPGNIHFEKY